MPAGPRLGLWRGRRPRGTGPQGGRARPARPTRPVVAARPAPRVVAGLPVAVHDDEGEARSAVTANSGMYAGMPNYQRILEIGGADDVASAAIVGDERAVARQLQGVLDAGATDIWASMVPVGGDRETRGASIRRTRDLLRSLLS